MEGLNLQIIEKKTQGNGIDQIVNKIIEGNSQKKQSVI